MTKRTVIGKYGSYVEFIESVWQNSIPVTEDDINQNVINLCETVFTEIQTCSKKMGIIQPLFELFYAPGISFYALAIQFFLAGVTGSVRDWISAILGNRQYKACVHKAAVNWKSVMALALLGSD